MRQWGRRKAAARYRAVGPRGELVVIKSQKHGEGLQELESRSWKKSATQLAWVAPSSEVGPMDRRQLAP